MNHVIIGTAGHIDHGKTALVRALTGIECDTHPEERVRGITINLGFAHLSFPDGSIAGIVDVPGHRDFIHTMVAGASGIDMALLVIAADGGIMPQTREHMAIMSMLGIRRGCVAITRIDLVDPDILSLAKEEVESFVKGTFLEGAPVCPVSSRTGEGIGALREALGNVAAAVDRRVRGDLFRMYIDRIFSVAGFGTVVTGSVLGGRIAGGERLYLLPGGREVRVRRVERYGHEIAEVEGGDRASLNLVGLSREEFVRGMMVSDRRLRDTVLLDGRIELFAESHAVTLWSRVQFFMGTFEAQVRMHLIDTDVLRPGGSAVVQLHLPQPCVAQAGDRFVLRSTSNDRTIGGGAVIDAAPLHHRRRPARLVEKLHAIAGGDSGALIAAEIRKHPGGIPDLELTRILNCTSADILEAAENLPEDIVMLRGEKETFFLSRKAETGLRERILSIIGAYHRRNPLDEGGRTVDELRGMLGLTTADSQERMLQLLLAKMAGENRLAKVQHTWTLIDHRVDLSKGHVEEIAAVEAALAGNGLQTPLGSELRAFARGRGMEDHRLRQILNFLAGKKRAYFVEDSWLHASKVDPAREKLLGELQRRPEGLTVAQFRDLIGGNRKICLLLYALFDREGLTVREGDVRRMTADGRRMLELIRARKDAQPAADSAGEG